LCRSIYLICLVLFLGTAIVYGRNWTTVEGQSQEGDLFEVHGSEVGLKIKGREYRFSINRFVPSDQKYIREWSKVSRCHRCSLPLGNGRIKEAGNYNFHVSCFNCLVCEKVFQGGEKLKRDEWGGLVHASHFNQAKMCDTCSKILSVKNISAQQVFKDGRMACNSCASDGVFESKRMEEVRKRVWPTLSSLGISSPVGNVIIRVVGKDIISKQALKINARGNLRGLTLTTYKIVSDGRITRTSFAHEIFILYGMPHIECASVLAHEYAHIWLNERFIEDSPPVVEGFCNVVSDAILSKEKGKLASIIHTNMKQSDNPVYGAGYRRMKQRLTALGWPALLTEMKLKSKPPTLK
jgi:predicted ester cyclase